MLDQNSLCHRLCSRVLLGSSLQALLKHSPISAFAHSVLPAVLGNMLLQLLGFSASFCRRIVFLRSSTRLGVVSSGVHKQSGDLTPTARSRTASKDLTLSGDLDSNQSQKLSCGSTITWENCSQVGPGQSLRTRLSAPETKSAPSFGFFPLVAGCSSCF